MQWRIFLSHKSKTYRTLVDKLFISGWIPTKLKALALKILINTESDQIHKHLISRILRNLLQTKDSSVTRYFVRTRRLQIQGEFVYMFSALTGRTKCKQSRLALATCKDGQNAWLCSSCKNKSFWQRFTCIDNFLKNPYFNTLGLK